MNTGILFAGFLVVYSTLKTVLIGRRKTDTTLLGYDISVLTNEQHVAFGNIIKNVVINLTFFLGILIFMIDNFTEYGLYAGICITIFSFGMDYYVMKFFIPKQYDKIKRS